MIIKIKVVMQLSELENNFDSFWFVGPRETSMLLTLENSITALVYQMWTDGIFLTILSLVPRLLLWNKDNSDEVFRFVRMVIWSELVNSALDVAPNVRCIIPIEVYYCFVKLFLTLMLFFIFELSLEASFRRIRWVHGGRKKLNYLIEVLLVSLWANDVDTLMERHTRVFLEVGICHISKNSVI